MSFDIDIDIDIDSTSVAVNFEDSTRSQFCCSDRSCTVNDMTFLPRLSDNVTFWIISYQNRHDDFEFKTTNRATLIRHK
jgi:hypothetical protein